MDIDDVLSYEPPMAVVDPEAEPSSKRIKFDKNPSNSNEISSDDIDRMIELSDQVNEIDEIALKRLILQFERRVLKNQEMRIKHSDNPSKFMDSEVELFDVIKEMHVIATQPALYHIFIQLNVIPTLLGLLSHENTDVACAIVELIKELTDLDDVDEIDEVGILMNALIDVQITVLLVNNMERLNENVKEESEGIYNSLAIIENLTENYTPEMTKDIKPLITWLLKKLKSKPIFYSNKLYASEILSILLQNSEENRSIIGNLHGIDILLQVVSYYKRHDPASADEEEFMENLFNCLCSALMSNKNRELFYKGEGIELMNLILKEKRKKESNTDVKVCALKLLNYCLNTNNPDELLSLCCDKFVEILGLRVLMPLYVKPSSIIGIKRKKKQSLIDQVEEHSLSLILALLRFCKEENVKRVLNKFVELNMVKTDRLVELHLKYSDKLVVCDKAIRDEGYDMDDEGVKDEIFLRRLNQGGLFTLRIIDQIIVLMSDQEENAKGECDNSVCSVKERITKLLNIHKNSSKLNHHSYIKKIVTDCAKEREDKNEEMELLKLVNNF